MGIILPQDCLQCRQPTNAALCPPCRSGLELLDPAGRCHFCFSDDDLVDRDICAACLERPLYHTQAASALAHEGAGGALLHALDHGCAYLARGLAALMFMQFEKLGWPSPSSVVPMPISPLQRLLRGYSSSQLLAESLGKLLGVPCTPSKHILLIDGLMSPALNDHALKLIGSGALRVDFLTVCRTTW